MKKQYLRVITDKMLKGACPEQRAIFCEEWPDGAPVTVRAAMRAVKLGLDLSWLARQLLREDLRVEYQRHFLPLWAEYRRQQVPLWVEYQRHEARIIVSFLRRIEI